MNPLNMLKGMMGIGNPKDMAMKMLSQNNNPIFKNLIDMANKGDTKGVEEFARNYMKEQGRTANPPSWVQIPLLPPI